MHNAHLHQNMYLELSLAFDEPQVNMYSGVPTRIFYLYTITNPPSAQCFYMEVKVAVLNAISQSCN